MCDKKGFFMRPGFPVLGWATEKRFYCLMRTEMIEITALHHSPRRKKKWSSIKIRNLCEFPNLRKTRRNEVVKHQMKPSKTKTKVDGESSKPENVKKGLRCLSNSFIIHHAIRTTTYCLRQLIHSYVLLSSEDESYWAQFS